MLKIKFAIVKNYDEIDSAVFSDLAAPPQDLSCGPLPSALPALPSR